MKIRLRTLIVAVALAALIFGAGRTVSGYRIWIDPVTGSMKHESSFLIFPNSTEVSRSELERWIIRHEGAYKPRWDHLSTGTRTLFGRSFACSLSPPIFPLQGRVNAEFVRSSTDREIVEFVRIMRTGTEEEQKQAVNAAIEKVLK
jgi:hypothetical protein